MATRKAVEKLPRVSAGMVGSAARKTARKTAAKPAKKAPARKRNPVASRDTIKAARLYQAFTGHEPETLGAIDFKLPKSMMVVGTCDAIEYTTVRAGKTERYRHVFRKSDRPQLLVSGDGKQTILAEGRYEFTERGFIDDSDTKNRY